MCNALRLNLFKANKYENKPEHKEEIKEMKKTLFNIFASLFFITAVSAQTPEYEVVINDRLSVGTRRAFECVATIANLAGFEEYSRS